VSEAWASRLAPVGWALALAPAGALVILLADRTHPIVPVALAAGAGAVLLAYLRPLIALMAALALVPLEVFAIPLGAIALSPAELLFVLTGLVWAARRLLAAQPPWVRSPLTRPLFLLWLAGLPGVVVAEDPTAVIRFLVIWGAFVLVFHLVVAEARAESVRTLLFALAMTGAVVGIVAVSGVAGQQELDELGATATGRATGAFGDPNILATFLAMALPAALLVAFEGRWRRGPLALSAAALIFAGLAFSLSRGGFLAATGAGLVMLGWRPLRRLVALGVIVLLGVTLLNANPLGEVQQVQVVLKRVQSVQLRSASQTDQRALIYEQTPGMVADNLLTGVGALNYPNVAPRYGVIDPATGDTFDHAHNIVLTFGAELGLLGLIALVWLVVAVVRLLPAAVGRRAGASRGLGFALVASLVALSLQGMVDFTLRSNVIAGLTFLLLGALAVVARQAPSERPQVGAPAA